MRLDFNVLWVEDNQTNVQAQKDRIENQIRRKGFRLCVKFASSVDQASSFLKDDIYGDHIDLILMDYDLGPGKKGDDGLVEVRSLFPYKDIIFYSANSTANLLQKVTNKNIQGIYNAHRGELPDTVIGVFENLVRKVLDIDHSRGIVMGATSDIDQMINELLCKHFEACDAGQQANSIVEICNRLDKKKADLDKNYNALMQITHVNELFEHHAVYTSDDRLRLLVKVMNLLSVHKKSIPEFEDYRKNVTPKRNALAHVRVESKGFSRKLYDQKGKELSSEDMNELRRKLLSFQETLISMLN